MSNYYTKTGDDGTSGLLGEIRVQKNHPKLEAIGAIDEANAVLGVIRAQLPDAEHKLIITIIQRDLYNIMSEIAATPENVVRFRKIDKRRVTWLEEQVKKMGDKVEMPKGFILPGDTLTGAFLDLARTVIRRAERIISALYHNSDLENQQIMAYLNRLSTFFFIFELFEIKNNKVDITLTDSK